MASVTGAAPVAPLMVVGPDAERFQSVAAAVPPSSLTTFLTRVSRAELAQDSVVSNGNLWISRRAAPRVTGPWEKLAAITLPSMFWVGAQITLALGA